MGRSWRELYLQRLRRLKESVRNCRAGGRKKKPEHPPFRANVPASSANVRAAARSSSGYYLGSFANHGDGDVDHDVGVQRHGNRVVAGGLQRTVGHAHLGFFNSEALLRQRFSDVEVGDGTEQTAIDTGLLGDRNGHAGQLVALGLRCGQLGCSSFFQFSALDFKFSDSRGGGATGHALGDQEVTCVTVLDFDDVAQVADVNNFFQQNDLHSVSPGSLQRLSVVQVGVRQQREVAGALDGGVHLTLVVRLGAGQTCWHDLAVFLNEILERVDVFVVDLFNVSGREAAELLTFEQRILLLALFFQLELVFVELFTECHVRLLYLNGCTVRDSTKINDVKHQAFAIAGLLVQKSCEPIYATERRLTETA